MVHFFRLLLVTGVTCLGLVPLVPSQVSRAVNILPTNLVGLSATRDNALLQLVQAQAGQPATAQAKEIAAPQFLGNVEKLLIPHSDRLNAEQILKWLVLAIIPVGVVGTVLYCLRPSPTRRKSTDLNETISATEKGTVHAPNQRQDVQPLNLAAEPLAAETPSMTVRSNAEATESQLPDATFARTTRISKVDIVEALIGDLHHPELARRRKSIWELGQRGDSRAIQPLVDLLVDADSQQRSLILAAIAEISTRTLKPMHRALLMSLQDESADVRKNAIRDITRIYDQMAQVSQLLQYAASDTDADVQETARWALGQLNRLRTAPEQEQLKPSRPDELPMSRDPRSGD